MRQHYPKFNEYQDIDLISGIKSFRPNNLYQDHSYNYLKLMMPDLENLDNNSQNSIRISQITETKVVASRTHSSTIDKKYIKYSSFDMYDPLSKTLFHHKANDANPYSNNKGGGEQKLKVSEIENYISLFETRKCYFEDREIKINLLFDGKTKDTIEHLLSLEINKEVIT